MYQHTFTWPDVETACVDVDSQHELGAGDCGERERVMRFLTIPRRLDTQPVGAPGKVVGERQVLEDHDAVEKRHTGCNLAPRGDLLKRNRLVAPDLQRVGLKFLEP